MGKRDGFTLMELLIVIIILSALASFILSGILRARHAAYTIQCTSQLRQLGMAFSMYIEDFGRRPPWMASFVAAGYLDRQILLCPMDPIGNYGGLVQRRAYRSPSKITYSYLYFGYWSDRLWNLLLQDGTAGFAVCQLHGEPTKFYKNLYDPESASEVAFEGLVLRLRMDGAVVRRRVILEHVVCPPIGAYGCYGINPWHLLADSPPPYPFNNFKCCEEGKKIK